MPIAYIIIYTSMAAWVLPPFRQYRTRYFYFFLILGLSDPLTYIAARIFSVDAIIIYAFSTPVLVLSLINIKNKFKIILLIISAASISMVLAVKLDMQEMMVYLLLQYFIIWILIFRHSIIMLLEKGLITLFNIFLNIYILSLLMKFIIIINNTKAGVYYFYISSAFEILIGIFFIIYNEKNSPAYRLLSKGKERYE